MDTAKNPLDFPILVTRTDSANDLMKKFKFSVLLLCALTFSGCSSSFLYNQLDWLIPWLVDDYVDLSRDQKKDLKSRLQPLLKWHREEELRAYLALVDSIAADLEQALSPRVIQRWANEMWLAYERLERQSMPVLFAMGDSFSNKQMREFMDSLYKDQKKLEEKYLDRTAREFREESYDDFQDNLQDFIGRLQPEQKQRIELAAGQLQRFDDAWLEQRRNWLDTLSGILIDRDADWQQQIEQALSDREKNRRAAYIEGYENNQRVIFEAVVDVLNSRTEKQDGRLQREINNIREDLLQLLADILDKTTGIWQFGQSAQARLTGPGNPAKHGLERAPDGLGNDAMAGGRGMNPVALVEFAHGSDVLQQERDEHGPVLLRQLVENRLEPLCVGAAQIPRCAHSGDHDLDVGVSRSRAVDDGLQILAHRFGILTAQHVVGTEFDDQHADRLTQQPVEPAQSARRRVAADAGVDDAQPEPGGVDAFLNPRGIGLIGRQSVARRQARAEEKHRPAGPLGRNRRGSLGGCRVLRPAG